MSPNEKTPLDVGENDVAHWLGLLGLPGLKPLVREQTQARLAEAFMAERIAHEATRAELATALGELAKARTLIHRLQAFENSVASLVLEHREPAAPAPVAAPRLQLVRPEPARDDTNLDQLAGDDGSVW